MKIILLLLLISFSFQNENENELNFFNEEKDYNISILSDKNFSLLKNNSLILFYSSTCPYCKDYKPIFLSLTKKLKDFNFVVIEEKNRNLTKKLDVNSFPTLKYFYNNKFYSINDSTSFQREEKTIEYLNKIHNDFVIKINNENEINNFLNKNYNFILLSTLKEKKSFENFKFLAEKTFDLISFLHCDSNECENKYENEIILFKIENKKIIEIKKFSDEIKNKFFSFENIKFFLSNFIIKNGEKVPKNIIEILFEYNRTAFFFISNDFKTNSNEIQIFNEIFEIYKQKLYFFYIDLSEKNNINKDLIEFFEIENIKNSKVFILQPNEKNSDDVNLYEFNKKITKNSLIIFIQDFFNKKLLKILESEKIPSKNEQKEFEFKLIVGKNFDNEITFNNKSNDVLLIITKNDFEVKEKMLNMFNKLAFKYNNKNYLNFCVTKMPENEIRGSIPSKIPSIYLYKLNDKLNPISYPNEIKNDFNEFLLLSWIEQNLNKNNNKNNNKKSDL